MFKFPQKSRHYVAMSHGCSKFTGWGWARIAFLLEKINYG